MLSPLLSNRYLHEPNAEAERRGWAYVGFADDIRLLARNKREAAAQRSALDRVLRKRLRLRVNPTDSGLAAVGSGFPYLGLELRGARISIDPKRIANLTTGHARPVCDEEFLSG